MHFKKNLDECDRHQLSGLSESEILKAIELGGPVAKAFDQLTLMFLADFKEYRKTFGALPPEMMIVRAGSVFEKLAVRQMVEIFRSTKN